jgi:hypothetical protein
VRERKKWRLVTVAAWIALVLALSITLSLLGERKEKKTSVIYQYDSQKPGLSHFQPGKYEGVSANYLSFATNVSSHMFPIRAQEFGACTGGRILFSDAANIFEDPITDLGSKASGGVELFDGYLMSYSHFPEASYLGLLEHLNQRIRKSEEQLQYQDILPKVRSMGEFRKDGVSNIDFLMYDGDFFAPIVRLDLLEKHSLPLPNTWDELVEIAAFFNGTDLNDDGITDYGLCHFPRKGDGYMDWWFAEGRYHARQHWKKCLTFFPHYQLFTVHGPQLTKRRVLGKDFCLTK